MCRRRPIILTHFIPNANAVACAMDNEGKKCKMSDT